MKKTIFFAILILFANTTVLFAADMQVSTIRIGLESRYLNAWSVVIPNSSLTVGTPLGYGFVAPAHITGQNFRVLVDNNYYLQTDTVFEDFHTAVAAIEGFTNRFVGVDGNGFSVIVGPFTTASAARDQAAQLSYSVIYASNTRVMLMDGQTPVLKSAGPLHFTDTYGQFMQIGGRSYRGIIELGRHTGQGITPVNIVDIEEYLFSVVPSEMPALWHIEALKAQAVAARSFTHYRRGSHSHLGYELCDTIFSQVYAGTENEHDNSTRAVQETQGVKIFHGGNVILATYFSSSGGVTENSENVWLEALPYLRSVADNYEVGGMVWERRFTLTQLTNLASSFGIGTVNSVTITHTPAGRVSSLILNGSSGRHYVEREHIRTFFAPTADGSLPSRNFTMTGTQTTGQTAPQSTLDTVVIAENDNTTLHADPNTLFAIGAYGARSYIDANVVIAGATTTIGIQPQPESITQSTTYAIVFTGRGWGHGVGMSQFGANSMALLGFDHIQILQHYYSGVEVRRDN